MKSMRSTATTWVDPSDPPDIVIPDPSVDPRACFGAAGEPYVLAHLSPYGPFESDDARLDGGVFYADAVLVHRASDGSGFAWDHPFVEGPTGWRMAGLARGNDPVPNADGSQDLEAVMSGLLLPPGFRSDFDVSAYKQVVPESVKEDLDTLLLFLQALHQKPQFTVAQLVEIIGGDPHHQKLMLLQLAAGSSFDPEVLQAQAAIHVPAQGDIFAGAPIVVRWGDEGLRCVTDRAEFYTPRISQCVFDAFGKIVPRF
jgi:hypothetical protein